MWSCIHLFKIILVVPPCARIMWMVDVITCVVLNINERELSGLPRVKHNYVVSLEK